MMDGQVAAIRAALDGAGHAQTAILAYAAKYASALYGPFRDAVDVSIADGGDRKGYQQDPRNAREALAEIRADIAEGADLVMVKPALAYLDVIAAARAETDLPVAAYHVSGEYSMIKAAAERGWIDGDAVALEHLTAIKRAGADVILTYLAREVAERLPGARDLTNDELFARAQRVIPGGVNCPVRAFKSVGGTPYFVARAEGAHVWDVEGTRYLDLVQSYGADHRRPRPPRDRRGRAARRPSTAPPTARPTEREVLLAEAICRAGALRRDGAAGVVGHRGDDVGRARRARLHRPSQGREVRRQLPRPRRPPLAEAGSGLAALGLPGSAGVTDAAVADTVVAPYNEVPELDGDTACVIVEPVAANMGLVPPAHGFLEGLRAECDRVGALLIFDEVITGFRVAYGGAQETSGVTPDLTTFGKVIGGGLNIGAYGGRARRDAAGRARSGPCTRRARCRGTRSPPPPGSPRSTLLDRAAYARLGATRRAPRRPPPRRAFAAAGLQAVVPQVRRPRRPVLLRRAARRLPDAPSAPTPPATPPSSTPCSSEGSPWPRAPTRSCSPGSPTPTPSSTRSGRSPERPPPRRRDPGAVG